MPQAFADSCSETAVGAADRPSFFVPCLRGAACVPGFWRPKALINGCNRFRRRPPRSAFCGSLVLFQRLPNEKMVLPGKNTVRICEGKALGRTLEIKEHDVMFHDMDPWAVFNMSN